MSYKIRTTYNRSKGADNYLNVCMEVLEYDNYLVEEVLRYHPHRTRCGRIKFTINSKLAPQEIERVIDDARKYIEELRRIYIPPTKDVII